MKIKNITSILLIPTLLIASASANAYWQWNTLLGVSAGYADRSGDLEFYSFDNVNVEEATRKLDDSGFIWGVLGGLQAHCNNWLFGGELHVDWHNFDDTRSYMIGDDAAHARYERGTMLALSARAGYQMAPYFMPYIRIGVETSKDELTVTAVDPSDGTSLFGAANDKRIYRFLGGIGVEVPVSLFEGLSLRAEYNYHGKGKAVNVSGPDSDGDFINVGYKPKTHSGKISVVYNFI